MTLQEWVYQNWKVLSARIQVPSKALNGYGCKYRLDGNAYNLAPENCCFIGVVIPPEKYQSEWDDGCGWGAQMVAPSIWPQLDEEAITALCALQVIHDEQSPSSWESQIQDWCKTYGVTLP